MNPYLVADINQQGQQPGQPNPFSNSSPDSFIDVGGTLYFRADNGANGRELWKIDPITGNAIQLEINPGSNGASINDLTIFNNTLYFTVDRSGVDLNGLWKIGANGNPERVLPSTEIATQEGASFLLNFNGSLYFRGIQGRGLINKIDSSGTVTAVPYLPLQSDPGLNLGGTPTSLSQLAVVGNTIFFGASTLQNNGNGGTRNGLWKLNASGTGLEAVQLSVISPSSEQLTNVNGTLYFVKGETIINGVSYFDRTLWKSDGTPSGTVEVKIGSFRSDPTHPYGPQVSNLMDIGGTLYFVMQGDGLPRSIWRINVTGTPEMVKELNETSGFPKLFPGNGALYFTANTSVGGTEQLWKVSGANGTPTLINANGQAQQPHIASAIHVNGDLYFTSEYDASFRDNHLSLWKVDGSTGTATLLSDVAENTYAGSNITLPGTLAYNNGKLYFSANSYREGQELWAYDLNASIVNQPIRNDFNGDGKSDILWRNTDGSVATWQMNSSTATPSSVGALTPDWIIAGTGDFNGDKNADILLHNANGNIATWQMNGSTVIATNTISKTTADWKIAGTGDFNGDGNADILWRNDNGSVATWQMNGSTVTSTSIVGTPTADWKIAGTGDFNGDGNADILWRNDNGSVATWQMNGSTVLAAAVIAAPTADWKIAGTGDFNGDGKTDILFRNDNGSVAEWQMNGSTLTSTAVIGSATTDWKISGTGDYNGDGKADILWRNDNGGVATWQMNGANVLSAGLTSIPSSSPSWNIAAPIL